MARTEQDLVRDAEQGSRHAASDPGLIGILLLPGDEAGGVLFFSWLALPNWFCCFPTGKRRGGIGGEMSNGKFLCLDSGTAAPSVAIPDGPGEQEKVAAGHPVRGLGATRMCAES